MPPMVKIDRIDNLTLTERNGVVTSMTRKARIIFDTTPPQDYSVLTAALAVCPQPFETLATLGYESLVLVERTPTLVEDTGCVDVVLKYEHILQGPNQWLTEPPPGAPARRNLMYGKGKCSISEKTTNFYRKDGDPNAAKEQILVAHTFPINQPGVIGQVLDRTLPMTVIQGGEITVPFPQANFNLQGVRTTDNPWAIAEQFIARINLEDWLGKPKFTWICSEVQWEVQDLQTGQYKFTFEFQYNIDTWNPTVVFNDQRTGRPPANVVRATVAGANGVINLTQNTMLPLRTIPGTVFPFLPTLVANYQPAGIWEVPFLERIDFESLFSSYFEGFGQPVVN